MSFPEALKPATFWDAVTIRIPQTWKCVREPDGMWECYESDDTEMETIWVDHDVFRLPDDDSKRDEAFLAEVASVAETVGQSGDPGASRKIISASKAHTIVNVTGTTMAHEGDGAELYSSMWHHIGAQRPYCVMVHLKLIAPSRRLGDKDYAALVRNLDHSLMNAAIDWERLCPSAP